MPMKSIKMGFLEKFKSLFNLKARPVLFGTRPHPEFLISSRTETSFRSVYLWEGRPQPWINFYIFHIFSAIMTANTRKASGGGKVPKSVCFGCCVDIGKWSLASVWLVGRYDDQSSVACTIKLSIPPIIIHSLQQQRQQTTWVNPDPCFACTYPGSGTSKYESREDLCIFHQPLVRQIPWFGGSGGSVPQGGSQLTQLPFFTSIWQS